MERLIKTKKCSCCEQIKPVTEFWKAKSTKDGLFPHCIICNTKYQQEYRKNNTVKIKNRKDKYYQKNSILLTENSKQFYQDNLEKCKIQFKEYRKNNTQKSKNYRLNHIFGIDLKQYHQMYKDQNGCCAICEKPQIEFKSKLAVDHDHTTGKIRGLLCWNCNTSLGKFHDNVQTLQKAIEYLNKHKTARGFSEMLPNKIY